MYSLASQMDGLPIISLQTSEAVAITRSPVLDMSTLEVLAFRCDGTGGKRSLVLMTRDIRQLATDCVIVDSEDELSSPEDIIRLQSILKASYSPIDKTVVSDTGRKLGTVEDYSINPETSRVQKIFVRGSVLRSIFGSSLIVDRTQILDVTPKKITVREATVKASVMQSEPVPESPS